MPVRWTFSAADLLVSVVAEGDVDLTSAVDSLYQMATSPEFVPGCRVRVDLRGLSVDWQPSEAVEMSRVLGVASPLLKGAVAFLANGQTLELTRLAADMAAQNGLAIRAFDDPDEALAWLLEQPRVVPSSEQ